VSWKSSLGQAHSCWPHKNSLNQLAYSRAQISDQVSWVYEQGVTFGKKRKGASITRGWITSRKGSKEHLRISAKEKQRGTHKQAFELKPYCEESLLIMCIYWVYKDAIGEYNRMSGMIKEVWTQLYSHQKWDHSRLQMHFPSSAPLRNAFMGHFRVFRCFGSPLLHWSQAKPSIYGNLFFWETGFSQTCTIPI
jgi:hypothetical protein